MVKKADIKRSLKWHRFWALFALVGLFSCGFVLGVFYGDSKDMKIKSGSEECELYEAAIKSRIFPAEEPNFLAHYYNYVLYGRLTQNGCEENREMYENLATAELELVNLLKGSADIKNYEMHQIIMEYEAAKLLEDKNDFLKNSL